MKRTVKPRVLILLSAVMGLAVAALRGALYVAALDEKNLLTADHPLEILVWVLSACTLAALAALALAEKDSDGWEGNFRPGFLGAAGCVVLATGIAVSTLTHWNDGGTSSDLIRNVLGILSTAGMLWVAVCRLFGKNPFFACHALVCLFLCAYLLGQYRLWSSNPQLQDYVFFLLGCVFMALFAYQLSAFDAGCGSRRRLMLFGLAGVFCGFAAIYGAYDLPLCVCGAVWMLTNLCCMREEK